MLIEKVDIFASKFLRVPVSSYHLSGPDDLTTDIGQRNLKSRHTF